MLAQPAAKWIAAGVLAIATIPAVSFAHSHKTVQTAPAPLMATTATPAASTPSAAPLPVAASTGKIRHSHKHKHTKLAKHTGRAFKHKHVSKSSRKHASM